MDLNVRIPWQSQSNLWWNETCALIVEHFGLPGDRFTSHPQEDEMSFLFKSEKDATMCRLLISERL